MLKKIKEWGKSLNNRLMGIILLCGIVPVIFIVLFVASSYRRGIMEKRSLWWRMRWSMSHR